MEGQHPHHHGPPPAAVLMPLIFGKCVTKMIGALCRMKVFDYIPREGVSGVTASDVADRCGANSSAIYRTLRALTVVGLLVESADNTFTLTATGDLLRSDTPGSMREMAVFIASDWHDKPWDAMEHSLRTGDSSFPTAMGNSMFDWLEEHCEANQTFQAAMTSVSGSVVRAVANHAAYDYRPFKTICDMGGGHGMLLSSILKTAPDSKGILYELPRVAEGAEGVLRTMGVADRVEVRAGNMFHSVPTGVDLFVMKHIIHDWGHEKCVELLRNCAKSLNSGGKVLIFDAVIQGPGVPDPSKLLDVEMLVVTDGGRERTEAEFAALLSDAGLKLTRVIQIQAPVKIIEAEVA